MQKNLVFLMVFFLSSHLHAQELNKPVLDSIINQCEASNSNALLIYHKRKLVYKNYFDKPVEKIESMSATKSVVSLAMGLLLDQKFIDSLNQPVHTIYPEWKQGNKKLITIRHLLEHTSGLQNVANAGEEVEVAKDIVQLALCAELEEIPGVKYSYNNKSSNLLSGIIEKTSGLKVDKFLSKYLFDDLKISDFSWRTDEKGNPYGMAGLIIYPEDFAKIGLMILNEGKWNGKQIIGKKYLQEMIHSSDKNSTFGLQWLLTYENQYYALNDDFFASMKDNTDENTLQLAKKLRGNYHQMTEIGAKARSMYNQEEMKLVGELLKNLPPSAWKIEHEGKLLNYAASGYLGQYLIIVPEKDLIVVRMINAENYNKIPNNSGMENLRFMVNRL